MKLAEHFRQFLSNIEPTCSQIREAASGHATLRSRLQEDEESKECVLETFLSGSYARSTAIRPVKDVDIVSVLDLDPHNNEPAVALSFVQQVLKKYYPSVKRQRRSLRITLTYVVMDLVPAVAPYGLESELLIPDRDLSEWVPTHPKGHLAHATQLNTALEGRFIPLVKAMKWWRDYQMPKSRRPASFLLEVIVGSSVSGCTFDCMAAAVCSCFEGIGDQYRHYADAGLVPAVPDPVLPGNNVASDWVEEDFAAFMTAVDKSSDLARAALNSKDKDESVGLWQKLFGSAFPTAT